MYNCVSFIQHPADMPMSIHSLAESVIIDGYNKLCEICIADKIMKDIHYRYKARKIRRELQNVSDQVHECAPILDPFWTFGCENHKCCAIFVNMCYYWGIVQANVWKKTLVSWMNICVQAQELSWTSWKDRVLTGCIIYHTACMCGSMGRTGRYERCRFDGDQTYTDYTILCNLQWEYKQRITVPTLAKPSDEPLLLRGRTIELKPS